MDKMKKLFLAVLLMAITLSAFAQTSGSNATTNADTNSNASAFNGGIQLTIPTSPSDTKTTIKSAPSMGMGSFSGSFSSDYCSGTAQAALSVVGTGIGGGAPVVDEVCQYLRIYERIQQGAASAADANLRETLQLTAIDVLCLTKPEVKAAFQDRGMCLDQPKKAIVSGYTGNDPIVLRRLASK